MAIIVTADYKVICAHMAAHSLSRLHAFMCAMLLGMPALGWHAATPPRRRAPVPRAALSAADEQRLLMSEKALNAFIVAEMRSFCEESMRTPAADSELAQEIAQIEEEIRLMQDLGDAASPRAIAELEDEIDSLRTQAASEQEVAGCSEELSGEEAVDAVCETAGLAFTKLYATWPAHESLSNLGSAISFLRNEVSSTLTLPSPPQLIEPSDRLVRYWHTLPYPHSAPFSAPVTFMPPTHPLRRAARPGSPLARAVRRGRRRRAPRASGPLELRGRAPHHRHVPPPRLPRHVHQDAAAERLRRDRRA